MVLCSDFVTSHYSLCGVSIGSARFLKTVRGRHRNGPLVIKVFIKPSADLTLRDHKARLRSMFIS